MAANPCIVDLSSSDDDTEGERDEPACISSRGSSSSVSLGAVLAMVGSDDDDVVILDDRPCLKRHKKTLSVLAKCSNRSMEGEDAADLDCCIVESQSDCDFWQSQSFADDSEDVVITAEIGQVACRDFPHSRHMCVQFPFKLTPHENHCLQCHCYVCDQRAPCLLWNICRNADDHCHATDGDKKWRLLRESTRKSKSMLSQAPSIKHHQQFIRPPLVISLSPALPSLPPVAQPEAYSDGTPCSYGTGSGFSSLNGLSSSSPQGGPCLKRPAVFQPVRNPTVANRIPKYLPAPPPIRPKLPFSDFRPHKTLPARNSSFHQTKRKYTARSFSCQPWRLTPSPQIQQNFSIPFPNSSMPSYSSPQQSSATFGARADLPFQTIGMPHSSQVSAFQRQDFAVNSFPAVSDLPLGVDPPLPSWGNQPPHLTPGSGLINVLPPATTPSLQAVCNVNSVAVSASYDVHSMSQQENASKVSQFQSNGSWMPFLPSTNSPEDVAWVDELLGPSNTLPSVQEGQPNMLRDILAQLPADDSFWDFELPAEIAG